MLTEAFNYSDLVRMVNRHDYDSTGMQLSDRFMSYLEVLRAWASLPYYQRRSIELWIGPERQNQAQIGRILDRGERTVREDIRNGIEAMVGRVYAESSAAPR